MISYEVEPLIGVIHKIEMAVEIGPADQGQQLGGRPIEQDAVGITANHQIQIQALSHLSHQPRLTEPATFQQLEIHPIHVGGKAQQIL